MNELALFAGAGGGILGGHLLGWRTVCAVERDAYAAQILAQRQTDGLLPPFPIWSDVCSFDGRPWRGLVDVVSGDFLVRTSRSQAMASVSPALAQDYGGRWHELPMRYDRTTSNWRTHHCLWEEDLPWCSVTLPKWGMTRAGVLSERLTSAPLISVTGSGSSQKTPARRWPTPVASMAKGSCPAALTRRSGADRSNDRLDHAVMALDGGHLNPEWAEWLMGWPIGWTDLRPLAMDRFQSWQQQRSNTCQDLKMGEGA